MKKNIMIAAALWAAPLVYAHCDSLDGPVVVAARQAIATARVEHVLPWVPENREGAIREAFARTMKVRALDPAAAELADTWFFETVVRIHRVGEGASYDGLKPAGSVVDEGIQAADRALAGAGIGELEKDLTRRLQTGLQERFRRVQHAKDFRAGDVPAARRYVAAYVDFVHFAERAHSVVKPAGESPAEHVH